MTFCFYAMLQRELFEGSYFVHVDAVIIKHPTQPVFVTTVAGGRRVGHKDGPAKDARFMYPRGVCVDKAGRVWVTDSGNHRICIIENGVVATVAGGTFGQADGKGRQAQFKSPGGLAMVSEDSVLVADRSNDLIRCVRRDGTVTTRAGSRFSPSIRGDVDTITVFEETGPRIYTPATKEEHAELSLALFKSAFLLDGDVSIARFSQPEGIAVDGTSRIYVSDWGNDCIREIFADRVTTLELKADASHNSWPPVSSPFNLCRPAGIAWAHGKLHIADSQNYHVCVVSGNQLYALAGSSPGHRDGEAKSAGFRQPNGIVVAHDGTIYVADSGNNCIRQINPDGTVLTLAGGIAGYQDGWNENAQFNTPTGLALDKDNNLLVADQGNHSIRKVWLNPNKTVMSMFAAYPIDSIANGNLVYDIDLQSGQSTHRLPPLPSLKTWEDLPGRYISHVVEGARPDVVTLYFEDAQVSIEGFGDDARPYLIYEDRFPDYDFTHLVGLMIVKVAVGEINPDEADLVDSVDFTFDNGQVETLSTVHGYGLKIVHN